MNSGFEDRAFDFEVRDVAGCCYVSHGFTGADYVDGHHWEDEGAVDYEGKCVRPDERNSWGLLHVS